ncbi:hypothetical protein AAFC00_001490 [Neodothiora populina]|uniref:Mediator complex subunit 11 n=1 Tax=Neodothiora populina TaxID=2781224 RepID=A0ABR3PP22_9PEZI
MTDPTPPANKSDTTWTVDDYEAALAHLEALQDQITALRTTIPSMVRPLAYHPASLSPLTRTATTPSSTTAKSQAFTALKKAAITAVSDARSFRGEWEGEQTRRILEKARESRAIDGDLSRGRDVPVFGWIDARGGGERRGVGGMEGDGLQQKGVEGEIEGDVKMEVKMEESP